GLKIDTFNKLSDLITDQLKRKTPFEFKEYYLDEWANMNSPVQLAEKLEEFEDFKRTLKQKSSGPNVKKQEFRFTGKNRSGRRNMSRRRNTCVPSASPGWIKLDVCRGVLTGLGGVIA
ncbi:hypothetical protein TNCV_1818041, partial [Trichonephila clavipes]